MSDPARAASLVDHLGSRHRLEHAERKTYVLDRPRVLDLKERLFEAAPSLGAEIPENVFPQYANAPWANLQWYSRWLHR
jgi:hypothetical protein